VWTSDALYVLSLIGLVVAGLWGLYLTRRPARFTCPRCGRGFTVRSASAFSGYRWPADVILMAVRWYLRHPLSGTSAMELLAERGFDVSNRTVLRCGSSVRATTGG